MFQQNSEVTRREALRRGGLVLAGLTTSAIVGSCGNDDDDVVEGTTSDGGEAASKSTRQSVFADFGGSASDARRSVFFAPLADEGLVVTLAPADYAKFRLMAERERSEWDAVDAGSFVTVQWLNDDLLEELPEGTTLCDRVPEEYQPYATGGYTQSFNIGYRRDAFGGRQPESWSDFWDVEKFPGKRGWPAPFSATLEAALMADGVAPDDLYPIDFDRAFAKLDELRPHLVLYESYGQSEQYLQSRTVDIIMTTNGRIAAVQDQGVPAEIVWNQAVTDQWTCAAVPRGAPNSPDAVRQMLNKMAEPEAQAEFARRTTFGPTQSAAYDLLEPEHLDRIAATPEHLEVAALRDAAVLADQQPEYVRRYSEWVAGV